MIPWETRHYKEVTCSWFCRKIRKTFAPPPKKLCSHDATGHNSPPPPVAPPLRKHNDELSETCKNKFYRHIKSKLQSCSVLRQNYCKIFQRSKSKKGGISFFATKVGVLWSNCFFHSSGVCALKSLAEYLPADLGRIYKWVGWAAYGKRSCCTLEPESQIPSSSPASKPLEHTNMLSVYCKSLPKLRLALYLLLIIIISFKRKFVQEKINGFDNKFHFHDAQNIIQVLQQTEID